MSERAIPESELVPVVRRAPESANDWESAMGDPAKLKRVKYTVIPRPGMTQREVEEHNERLRAATREP